MSPDGQGFTTSPFFLAGASGPLFSLHFAPRAGRARRGIVFCPPFGEEMNRSRRSVALQARRMAASGIAVLLVDPYGTGDSAGEFGEASLAVWLDDLRRAHTWLRETGCEATALWGLRLGASLALLVAQTLGPACDRLLLWQPVLKGRVFMTQFLRLKIAAQMLSAEGDKGGTAALRQRILAGETVEIGGYQLTPDMLTAVDALDTAAIDGGALPPVEWIEMVAAEDRPATAASRRQATTWRDAGARVAVHTVAGANFWSMPEIVVVDDLLAASDAAMERWRDEHD